jgi:hypothetical protein
MMMMMVVVVVVVVVVVAIYLSMALQPFCWTLAAFQFLDLLYSR